MTTQPTDALERLLSETEGAHGVYETTELAGVYDQEWPRWYAAYAVEHGFAEVVGRDVAADDLADLLTRALGRAERPRPESRTSRGPHGRPGGCSRSWADGRSATTFDLVIIGAGAAGESAAYEARELGLRVAIVDRRWYGGSCPHIACVPSKALLHAAAEHQGRPGRLSLVPGIRASRLDGQPGAGRTVAGRLGSPDAAGGRRRRGPAGGRDHRGSG